MKTTFFIIAMVTGLFSASVVSGQQKYNGTMITKMGKKETGIITVNLNGSNDELIEIAASEQTKTKGGGKKTKETITSSMKLNVAFINSVIINDSTYYFRDIKYDYNDKYFMNVCVRLIKGTLDCGIFQRGNSKDQENIYIKLPNNDFSKLVSVDFDYYKATQGWHIMAFRECSSLRGKMEAKQPGYSWDDNTSREQRIGMWKNWIEEFNACK